MIILISMYFTLLSHFIFIVSHVHLMVDKFGINRILESSSTCSTSDLHFHLSSIFLLDGSST